MTEITMPQLGETVTEGTVTHWHKQVGDRVEVDEILFDVTTDKVETEVPSPVAGYVGALLVAEGETVPVGTRLAVITSSPDEVVDDAAGRAGGRATAGAASAPSRGPRRARSGRQERATRARDDGDHDGRHDGNGRGPRPGRARATTSTRAAPSASPTGASGSTGPAPGGAGYLSPAVRARLAARGLRPEDVPGSGRDGRITVADVEAARPAESAPRPAPAAAVATATPSAAPALPTPVSDDEEVVPFSVLRRATAEHMVRSQATSAHTLVAMEVDYQAVDAVRRATGLSYLPFVARAVIDALARFPHLNARVDGDALVVHKRVHLGVAVDLDFEGLVVPVVHDAQDLRLRALAERLRDLAARAKAKRLRADDVAGGTFTITNAGGYGTFLTVPIINQPQVAILSTDGVRMRPVAVPMASGEWGVAVRPVGNLALSFDHRAFDGAYASAFLSAVREVLETRAWGTEV